MTLLIDRASSARRLSGGDLRQWATTQTAFISSEMRDLLGERAAVAEALRNLGMRVIAFEDLGGRDDAAVTAYLDGVAQSDVYIGIVADRYGRMQSSGRSPTHDEYREARGLGKRISVWVAGDGDQRQGNARDFVDEVQAFHTTGSFNGSKDLARRIIERMGELAADDIAPWVNVGHAVFRAGLIRDLGDRVEIEAEVRDPEIAHYLQGLRPDQWQRANRVAINTGESAGEVVIESVASETRASSWRKLTVAGPVTWADGSGDSMAAGVNGYSPEELVELGLRAGLFGEPLPERLQGVAFMVPEIDPLAGLPEGLPHATYQAAAHLLMVEALIGSRKAGRIESFAMGPPADGGRRLQLSYLEARRFNNVDPGRRELEGVRAI